MGSPKNLNDPKLFAEALVRAVLEPDAERLTQWLAGDPEVSKSPFYKWHLYFAERLREMAPRPEQGFVARQRQAAPMPKIGRNDPCPCGSGKKFKQCHIGQEETAAWKLGSPSPDIRAMAVATLINQLPIEVLDEVPAEKASDMARSEMAGAYHRAGRLGVAMDLLKTVLDGDRDNPHMLFDYWIARYAEWLVEAGDAVRAEQFLLDEFDAKRGVDGWQVAQKLAAFYLDQGDPDNAEIWVESALEGSPDNPFSHYLNGLLRHSVENWEAAVAAYEKSLELANQFREQEREQMTALAREGLERARNHQPVEDEEPGDGGGDGEQRDG